ncbi:MAG: sigma-70 family RNA polymerase sigma factor [Piscinibacter sp.]|uniref:RNA polymerase sigma factor n=1 Tax=Piscinibacter sp. TaxID=1903157 RepID=UPI002582B46F|nr:sigma-70 family RNA polymerase sigma factor [Piscinibacter sp.]MCW5665344.1 sigma-70 family RNA polymerase sigma factor [Piscinibacter sp.]
MEDADVALPADAAAEVAAAQQHRGRRARRDAAARQCRAFAPRVRRYGLRHLRDGHAAGDLMQIVLLRVLEQLRAGKVREPQRIVSFVFGTCRMVLHEWQRGELQHERALELAAELLPPADIAPAPRLDERRVADCLGRLAERERSVIVLSFFEERTAEEVGVLLGTTAGNVRVIRHRGLARLRGCVEGAPP